MKDAAGSPRKLLAGLGIRAGEQVQFIFSSTPVLPAAVQYCYHPGSHVSSITSSILDLCHNGLNAFPFVSAVNPGSVARTGIWSPICGGRVSHLA